MVCVTPDTAVPATIDPALAVLQVYPDTSAVIPVPLVDGSTTALVKLQLGVVLRT